MHWRVRSLVISKPIRVKKKTVSNTKSIKSKLTTKQKVLAFVKSQGKPTIINDFYSKDKSLSRRVVERAFTDLTNSGYIKRERCMCGCSYVYRVD